MCNFHRYITQSVANKSPDLSQRQLAVLHLTITLNGAATVRGMAATLSISKPAVTRALNRLNYLNYAKRSIDPADRRSIFAVATPRGSTYYRNLLSLLETSA